MILLFVNPKIFVSKHFVNNHANNSLSTDILESAKKQEGQQLLLWLAEAHIFLLGLICQFSE